MSMLEAALAYARRGWPVFPCDPRQDPVDVDPAKKRAKRPLVPGADKDEHGKTIPKTGGLYRATTDEAQIRRWWTRTPHALIGVPTGARIGAFVVDLDPRDGESLDEVMARLEAAVGEIGWPRVRSRTQSGGLHLWFALPEGEPVPKNRAGKLKGVDWRGDGGYVIAPPSVMSDGAAYAWELSPFFASGAPDAKHESAETGNTRSPWAGLPDAPAQLLDLIYQRGAFAAAPKPDADAAWVDSERFKTARRSLDDPGERRVRQFAQTVLDRARADIAGAAKGARSDTLNAASYGVAPLVGLGVLSMREAYAALRDGADAAGCNDNPTKRDDTIKRALEAGLGNTAALKAKFDEIREDARAKAERYGPRPPEPPLLDRAPDGPEGSEGSRLDVSDDAAPDDPEPDDPGDDGDDEGSRSAGDGMSPAERSKLKAALIRCGALDHSDTDNGRRLIEHFGDDLLVLAHEGARNMDYVVWEGAHWDMRLGLDAAWRQAQQLGQRIMWEARYLPLNRGERRILADYAEAAEIAIAAEAPDWELAAATRAAAEQVPAALLDPNVKAALKGLEKRQIARRKFGVSSKNKSRLEAMLSCAAAHLTTPPDAFNAHKLRFATRTHTLVFEREAIEGDSSLAASRLVAAKGHDRAHRITRLLPADYDPKAEAPLWRAFLERFLPEPETRAFVQTFSGLALTGLPIQRFVYHYGKGANGKSVFLEVLGRTLGFLALSLGSETVTGTAERSAQGASPDLAGMYGKWLVRVPEIPEDQPLRVELVKKLTGGEPIVSRNLFKGQFEFTPVAKLHMSGNGFPKVNDTSNGIWRRMAVIEWPVSLSEEEQRNFEDVVSELAAEAAGILNWLIEGALRYFEEGLVTPPSVRLATETYKSDSDPVGRFVAAVLEPFPGGEVRGQAMYEAYEAWAKASGEKPLAQSLFGKILKTKVKREDRNVRVYVDVRIRDLDFLRNSAASRNPEEWSG